jgi:hypothetical protein
LGQGQVFEESSNLLKRLCGVCLSPKQIERLCHHYGEEVESQLINNGSIVVEKSEELHYVMVDGSYILSRESGWTETKVGRIFKASSNFLLSEKRGSIQESEYVAHIGTHTDFIAKFSPLLNGLSRFVFIADGYVRLIPVKRHFSENVDGLVDVSFSKFYVRPNQNKPNQATQFCKKLSVLVGLFCSGNNYP